MSFVGSRRQSQKNGSGITLHDETSYPDASQPILSYIQPSSYTKTMVERMFLLLFFAVALIPALAGLYGLHVWNADAEENEDQESQ
ncbi:hypothetical protein B2G88_10715 [Natronolimnobius baerhuensis]|uniref:Uncharacterized protein n=1 Tax=Natronolimnobius baerhuensis TaxID=253108 RepID=A0A202E9F0_9EURY|nr:hypothetical protein B2G88_10715 [Natronolimnobius baerhuensis]